MAMTSEQEHLIPPKNQSLPQTQLPTTLRTPTTASTTPRNSARTQLQKVTTPGTNPLFFKDSNDRQAAVLAKAQRIQASSAYGKLKPEQQQTLLRRYYKETVVPGYQSARFAPPDEETWVKGITSKHISPSDYYYSNDKTQNELRTGFVRMGQGAAGESATLYRGTSMAGVWVSEQATKMALGLASHFAAPQVIHHLEDQSKEFYATQRANIQRLSSDTLTDSEFWLQTHPSKSFAGRADSMLGEAIIQLPMYEVLSEGRLIAPGAKTLTAGLKGTSKLTKLVVSTLGNASDAFMSSMLEGQTKEQTQKNIQAWMGFGALNHVAGEAMMKSHIAKITAMGGKPFNDAITNEAEHELTHGIIGGQSVESQERLHEVLQRAHSEDPIKTGLVTSRKVILNSISHSNFQKPFKELSKSEQSKVRELHDLVTAQAIREIPLHVPEVAKANAQTAIDQDIKHNPLLAKQHEMLKQKYGIDAAKLLQEAEAKKVAMQTGVKNSQGAAKNIANGVDIKKAAKRFPQAQQNAEYIGKQLTQIVQEEEPEESMEY